MKRFIKFILKLFIPIHIRRKIRFLLNLSSYLDTHLDTQIRGIRWELKEIQSIIYTKENAPLVFDKITAPLINDPLFADTVVKDLNLSEFIRMQNDSWYNARMLVKRFAVNVNGLPINTVRDYLFRLVKIKPVCELAFYYLVYRLAPQYADDLSEKILEEAYSYLSFNDNTEKWFFKEGIMLYICFLMLRKDFEKAEKVFIKNRSLFEKDHIAAWLPVAYIARKNGMTEDNILMSAEIYKKFSDQEAMKNEFIKYIQDKSIAIVGNGPYEKNTGHGMEIDNHDIVVRGNSFVIDDPFKEDYGEKVNIYWHSNHLKIMPVRYSFDFIIFVNPMHYCIFPEHIREYIYENPEKKILNLGLEYVTFLQDNYNYYGPSTGMSVRLFFRDNLDKCKKLSFYGFSINEVIYQDYSGPPVSRSMGSISHDLFIESEIHKDLFKT